jgi:lipoyl(octanoyl) transferase
MTLVEDIVVKRLGRVPYGDALRAMREFTTGRTDATPDEIWIVEHPPVYTLGQGATSALKQDVGIPVVASDRGGEITYHGPGQAILYTLVDLARRRITVKRFVWLLEQAVIDLVGARARSTSV